MNPWTKNPAIVPTRLMMIGGPAPVPTDVGVHHRRTGDEAAGIVEQGQLPVRHRIVDDNPRVDANEPYIERGR
jgi:hypothetical protein